MTTENGILAKSSAELPLDAFPQNGCASLGAMLDMSEATVLREWIDARRPVTRDIFYQTLEEFEQHGRWTNYAPGRQDHNLLLSPELDLSFIEENPVFVDAMVRLCGTKWRIMKKSIIRSTPRRVLPDWLYEWMTEVGRPNLNPFVKDELQDVQYFLTTDFHQDKTRPESDFVTVYIYLDEVDSDYSALQILCGSHRPGMNTYPHNLRRDYADKTRWYYSDGNGNHETCHEHIVTGEPGSIFCFHCLTLHGTGFNDSENPRISLRYLIETGGAEDDETCLLSQANRLIYGPTAVTPHRTDVGPDGAFLRIGSSLLSHSAT